MIQMEQNLNKQANDIYSTLEMQPHSDMKRLFSVILLQLHEV